MHRKHNVSGSRGLPWILLLAGWFCLVGLVNRSQAQVTTLNVTNFGARGDAVQTFVMTVSNSAVITCATNLFSSGDVGKVIELFEAGAPHAATNHEDLIATIVGYTDARTVTLDRVCLNTAGNLLAVFGRNNAAAFQACLDSITNDTVVNIPDGRYLLLSPQAVDTNFVMINDSEVYPAVSIRKGGISFVGASRENTVLLGAGAWQRKGGHAYRGMMFFTRNPVSNSSRPLIFDSLTMDGGVQQGLTSYHYFPANINDGTGWDITHGAFNDRGTHALKIFRNCTVKNWRGEMFKSTVANADGFIQITNCAFLDGNATAINFSFSHTIENCFFSNLVEVAEFYQAYSSNTSTFRFNTVTNIAAALYAICGAEIGRINPPYNIVSNTFYMKGGNGIQTAPAHNVSIIGNRFIGTTGAGIGVVLGISGYQGSAANSNIVVALNLFTNLSFAFQVQGSTINSTYNAQIISNSIYATGYYVAYGGGWGTNIVFAYNKGNYPLNSTVLQGQYYTDDLSNDFPPYTVQDNVGGTNVVTYKYGARAKVRNYIWGGATNSVFVLDDTAPLKIPVGAKLFVTNSGNQSTLYTSSAMNRNPITMTNGFFITFQWTNGGWQSSFRPVWDPKLRVVQTNSP